jgi:hypothetical protein
MMTKNKKSMDAKKVSTTRGEGRDTRSEVNPVNNNSNLNKMETEKSISMANNESQVNNTVDNTTQKSMENLKKDLKKAERNLDSLIKKKFPLVVIEAQRKIVEELETEVANHPEMKASEIKVKPDFITFEVVDGDTYQKTEVSKKLAFVENNRPVDPKKVSTFISTISDGKYEKAYPVIVIPATSLVEQGYTVKDIEGNVITKEEAEDYFVILDGQHRSIAFARINATGETCVIPNVRVKEKENIGEYLVEINRVGNWDTKDKITVAALVNKEDELLNVMAMRMGEGFNPSTLGLIYAKKKLSDKATNSALKGEEYSLPQGAEINIERGNKFITLCQMAGIEVKELTKRYFIEGFDGYSTSTSEDKAFEALKKLGELKDKEKNFKNVKSGNDFIALLKKVSA